MRRVKNLLKHPLFIFIILGAFMYVIYGAIGRLVDSNDKKIVVSNAQIELLREDYKRTWSRYPTVDEMQNQIYGHIMDEIFYKEAVNMGLDKSDIAVKKRLRQLMEMMLDDYVTVYATEQQLSDYLLANPEKFRAESSISFSHLYFDVNEKEKATAVLNELRKGADISKYEHYSLRMLPISFTSETRSNVARHTGKEFAEQVFDLEKLMWHGPIASVYGWHLVWVDEVQKGKVPELDKVWDLVEREWAAEQKEIRKKEEYALMREQYKVVFEDSKRGVKDNS
ncbi:peptidyl-prolyl cis-trans isomerase [Carboxylicivirga sp. M1479]|uniref:peptidylprolyl isomerase n=1 Tax=Carboxylicivirga sp. M1479 TaxID=2594476 RepID=UPI0011778B56|nr:peptidylprolyl isomerase [Carboxylicivirga sp. M1479]TRX70244.1 peptidyl-prolyl cis-trans isomerase [Carboxylicivirga sp. M1479]